MAHTSRSISFDEKRHAPLLLWWDSQENASAVLRGLIEAHLAGRPPHNGLPSGIDLAAIRQVVEAAIDQKLAGLTLNTGPASEPEPETDALSAFDDLLE
jgi:hypothetical protein